MKPIEAVRELKSGGLEQFQAVHDKIKEVRIRTRTQMILLTVEQNMTVPQIGQIVRRNEQKVCRWIKRFNAEELNGMFDVPRLGSSILVISEYRQRLLNIVRQRPRALGQPCPLWTLDRLVDFMAEETGLRIDGNDARALKAADIVLSRPQYIISGPDQNTR
jgi:transposase